MKFKEGDGPAFAFHAQTTDKLMLAADNGRFYTLAADRLPGGRGFGEPVRLMVDIDDQAGIVALRPFTPGARLLMAASDGRGFIAKVDDLLAETRKGRQVVRPRKGAKLRVVYPIPADADHVASIGENRKLVIFALSELPEMASGQGVQLQRYRQGGLSDAIAFRLDQGLSWTMGGDSKRTRTETDLANWKTVRGTAGRLPPTGFPKENRFTR
jgi:topoisomerase-4 subunit A